MPSGLQVLSGLLFDLIGTILQLGMLQPQLCDMTRGIEFHSIHLLPVFAMDSLDDLCMPSVSRLGKHAMKHQR